MCSGHPTIREPNTLANINEVKVKHIHLDLTVDFVQRLLGGHATLTFEPLQDHIENVVLDTSFLNIDAVEMDSKPLDVSSFIKKIVSRFNLCDNTIIMYSFLI